MSNSSAKENILGKIRAAQKSNPFLNSYKPNWQDSIFKEVGDQLACFKAELETIKGECFICSDEAEFNSMLGDFLAQEKIDHLFCRDEKLRSNLEELQLQWLDEADFVGMKAALTSCECLIARTGSVIYSSRNGSGRSVQAFAPIHIVVARASQLLNTIEDGLAYMRGKYGQHLPSLITTITGPSRTADIEKTLVLGAHGPCRLVVFVIK